MFIITATPKDNPVARVGYVKIDTKAMTVRDGIWHKIKPEHASHYETESEANHNRLMCSRNSRAYSYKVVSALTPPSQA